MSDTTIYLQVKEDISESLRWIVREFSKELNVMTIGSKDDVVTAKAYHDGDVLILDVADRPSGLMEYINRIKSAHPALKMVIIVSPLSRKEEIISIINARIAEGIVLKPFTEEIIHRYLEKGLGATGKGE